MSHDADLERQGARDRWKTPPSLALVDAVDAMREMFPELVEWPSAAKGELRLTVSLSAEQALYLRALGSSSAMGGGSLDDIVRYILASVADGVRRPGSWERQCVLSMFGDFPEPNVDDGVLR